MSFGDRTRGTVIASGVMTLRCAANPRLEFLDRSGDDFSTDAWSPTHSTIADGAGRGFPLPRNGTRQIEIYGAGGDLIFASAFVSGGACTMIAHSISNFRQVLIPGGATAGAQSTEPRAGGPRVMRSMRRAP
jgi:hypothetical protein